MNYNVKKSTYTWYIFAVYVLAPINLDAKIYYLPYRPTDPLLILTYLNTFSLAHRILFCSWLLL